MFFNNCIDKNQNKVHFQEGSSEPPPLELFRKFIRFGRGRRPESCCDPSIVKEPNIIHIATTKTVEQQSISILSKLTVMHLSEFSQQQCGKNC